MFRSPAAGLFLLTFLVRFIVLNRLTGSPFTLQDDGDMKFYSDWALRIAHGQWTDHQAFYGLPGYAYLLAVIYAIAGPGAYLPALLQAICEAITASLIFLLAVECFRPAGDSGKRDVAAARSVGSAPALPMAAGILAGLGWTFYQPAQAFSVVLMPNAWMIPVFWGVVLWTIRSRLTSVWRPWLWIGLAIGTTAMMIATVLFLIPLVVVAIFLKPAPGGSRNFLRKLGAAIFLIAGVVAGCAPASLHNRLAAGEPVTLSAHGGLNLYVGNNPEATGYTKIPSGLRAGQAAMLKDSIAIAEAAEGRKLRRYEVSRYWSDKAKAYIREHPGDWLRLMGLKVRNLWNQYQYDDLSLIALLDEVGILTPGIRFGIVAALAIPGLLFCGLRFPRSRWVAAAALLQMAALLSVFVTERYRLAAVPGLLILGGGGLVLAWQAIVNGAWKEVAGYACTGIFGAVAVSWPVGNPELWSLDPINIGIKASRSLRETLDADSRARQLELARKSLEKGLKLMPGNAEATFALGNVHLEEGKVTEAKQLFRRTLELDPAHDGAWNNLGVLAMKEGHLDMARHCFERSLDAEPDDAETWYLLARVLEAKKDVTGALRAMRRADELEPGRPDFKETMERLEQAEESGVSPDGRAFRR